MLKIEKDQLLLKQKNDHQLLLDLVCNIFEIDNNIDKLNLNQFIVDGLKFSPDGLKFSQ